MVTDAFNVLVGSSGFLELDVDVSWVNLILDLAVNMLIKQDVPIFLHQDGLTINANATKVLPR